MQDINTMKSNKDLLIIVDCVELGSIDHNLLKNSDKLALSPGAMLACENSNLTYLTCNDLYDYKDFRSDFLVLIKETEDLFSLWDKKYEPFTHFPRSFSANIYWFLALFADIYYLSAISKKIKNVYRNIYLIGGEDYQGPLCLNTNFSLEGLIFDNLTWGLKNKAWILSSVLSARKIYCNKEWHETLNSCLFLKKLRLFSLLNKSVEKIIYRLKMLISEFLYKKKGTIFIIQGSHDINPLRNYLSDFLFLYPGNGFLKNNQKNRIDLKPQFGKELNDFTTRWFFGFEVYIRDLFNLYHENVVTRVEEAHSSLKHFFDLYKPKALFYAIGAITIRDDIFASLANDRGIPVFYFQHGGTLAFTRTYQCKYIEQSEHINKINIIHSKVERDLFSNDGYSEVQAFGSANFYKLFLKYSNHKFTKKRILYCTSLFNSYAYKSLMSDIPDSMLYEMHKDIVGIVMKLGLKMDIKVHPGDEDSIYEYFSNLLKKYPGNNIRALKGIYAELVIKDCDLLIIDFLASTLIQEAVILNIPVIVYIKDFYIIRQETFSDFQKIFYLIQDNVALMDLLSLHKEGKLKSKFSLDMVDKYVFPVNEGDPTVKISNYIRNKII